jgi:hypothetical protein
VMVLMGDARRDRYFALLNQQIGDGQTDRSVKSAWKQIHLTGD